MALSGEDALRIARKAHPDLILLDVMMPGIDGYETCARLKADETTRNAVVIFLSALQNTEEKVRGLSMGAMDFITKPFGSNWCRWTAKKVLLVECQPSPAPVFLKFGQDEDFYVRIGPGNRKLSTSEVLAYVTNRKTKL